VHFDVKAVGHLIILKHRRTSVNIHDQKEVEVTAQTFMCGGHRGVFVVSRNTYFPCGYRRRDQFERLNEEWQTSWEEE